MCLLGLCSKRRIEALFFYGMWQKKSYCLGGTDKRIIFADVKLIYSTNLIVSEMKKYNFGAGPSILPQEVMKATADACVEFQGMGLSLMEISHRTKEFQAVMDEAQALFKELLNIPEGYSVLFLGGGASLEFCMVPYNLLNKKAAYLNTGVWAKKALKEAKLFGEVVEVASSADANYTFIPKGYTIPADADYFHITTNNTIYGTELHEDLDSPVPLVADMSSDIFSRPVDVSKYGLIYGGAQKISLWLA